MKNTFAINTNTLEKLFTENYEGLCRYAHSIVKNQVEAEDLVQKLFLRLWEKKDELQILSDVKAYLYRSIRNASINLLESLKKNQIVELFESLEVNVDQNDGSKVLLAKEFELRIDEAMLSLPEKCREVFQLSRYKQLSYNEISEKLDISIKTVENHMGKALKIMRSELHEYLPEFIITILLVASW